MRRAHRLLSPAQKVRLRHLVETVERETGAEIGTLIVRRAHDVDRFATSYFNHAGIGKRDHHNGVLILVVLERRRIRIEVGHGLEAVVTPERAGRIIAEGMAPAFRDGRYGDGVLRAAEELAELIRSAHAGRAGRRPPPPAS